MAIILEAAYSKKLGLPNYSSHSYVVSIRTELADINQVAEESSKLYQMLQEAVDREIQEVGFIPDATQYGMNHNEHHHANGNGSNGNGHASNGSNGYATNGNGHSINGNGANGHSTNGHHPTPISDKQLDLINKIVRENNVEKSEVERMSIRLFEVGVRQLNKMQASNLIDELFEQYGKKNGSRGKYQPREYSRS